MLELTSYKHTFTFKVSYCQLNIPLLEANKEQFAKEFNESVAPKLEIESLDDVVVCQHHWIVTCTKKGDWDHEFLYPTPVGI